MLREILSFEKEDNQKIQDAVFNWMLHDQGNIE
jgi:hypothetical protein